MKKFIAVLTATALLAAPLCVSAAPSPSAKDVSGNSSSAVIATSTAASTSSESAASTLEAAAAAAGMSVAEYTNNAIISTPGIPGATVLAQGGGVKVNGVATNMTVTLRKASTAIVSSAMSAATGKILGVFQAKSPVANGNNLVVNFYVKGITADSNVSVLQLIKGVWTPLTLVEVRTDHVILNMSQSGPIMFVLN